MISRLITKEVKPLEGTKGDVYSVVYSLGADEAAQEYKIVLFKEDIRLLIEKLDNAIL
jgi:hypothetical protein